MDRKRIAVSCKRRGALSALAVLFALASVALAVAQEPKPPEHEEGFLAAAGRWFGEQASKLGSGFKDARQNVEIFGREAGVAAKSTAQGAKDAADAVVRIPAARSVSGHETCGVAPNGAPDCLAAADALCKGKGFASGKSLDMTTAEVCPPKVYASGRSTGPECKTETFVSRALCQ